MQPEPVRRGGPLDRTMAARAAVAIAVLVIAAMVLGPAVLRAPSPSPGHTSAPSSPVAGVPTTEPSASAEPWSDLAVAPYSPVAELVPTDQDRIGIGTTTAFTLRSLTAIPATALARGLSVDPPVELTIKAGATSDTATVRPLSPLAPGQRYRVRLESTDGSLAGSWSFRARAALHLVGTLPRDLATGVPTNTGIELTFDQDGVTGVADHFAIAPNVAGRFEEHGRTWAFVATKPLANATIYTVTVHRGVGLSGSTETLETDQTFRFETAATSAPAQRLEFGRAMIEIRPDTKPVVLVSNESADGEQPTPASIGITIHRLPDFAAVINAGVALAGRDSWAIAAPSATVSTKGLTEVAHVKAPILSSDAGSVMTIPVRLAKGAYVVTIQQPGPPAQLLVQATNLSAYAMTGTETSVAWVNNLGTDVSVAGATVSITNGHVLGSTGGDGVLRVATPRELAPSSGPAPGSVDTGDGKAQFLTVSATGLGRLLVPLGLPVAYGYPSNGSSLYNGPGSDAWWLFFGTDRTTYRQTDVVHAYGTIRSRLDRSVPSGIELRLRTADNAPDAPILRVPVHATARGTFTANIPITDLPRAQYEVDLFVGDELVSSVWVYVGGIVKPVYEIDMQADHRAYLAGDPVTISATTTFYDGTPVPGLQLQFTAGGQQATATTDALGKASVALKAITNDGPDGVGTLEVDVAPVHPEEGQIGASLYVPVVPARVQIEGTGTVTGGQLVVTGTLRSVDMAAYEAALATSDTFSVVPGAPLPGGRVSAAVSQVIEDRTQTGTTYDVIEKKVVPVYEYSEREISLGTHQLTSAADGTFKLILPVPVASDVYRIRLTAIDPERRSARRVVDASAPAAANGSPGAYLEAPGGCGTPSTLGRLDRPVTLTMHQGDGTVAPTGRFLFLIGERGSLETTVQASATFTRAFRDADVPGFTARGVWLTKDGYQVADVLVQVDRRDKAVTIRLQPDRPTYEPGDTVTIGVTTSDPSGRPVPADVLIQGVDQKLYTLGMAGDVNPLDQLLAQTAPGFLASYESHAAPVNPGGGCGDTGGGGRDDFRDTVTFQRITTDSSGHGTVKFTLSDDLTSWHISAMAVTGTLDAGQASVLIPVGLPFFVDASLAPEYLVGDTLILRLRAYGAGLAAGDRVRFVVSAPSLGLAPTPVDGSAFASVSLALPPMRAGDHAIRIEATGTHGATQLGDVLIRTVHVVDSRVGTVATSYDALGPDFQPQGGAGLTTYVISDAGRGRLIAPLQELAASTSARFDRSAAAELARQLLIDEFRVPPSSLPTTGFDLGRYQTDGGVALLPYASVDLVLSARAALVAGSIMDVDLLRSTFDAEFDGRSTTRERQIVALAGLAATGEDVTDRLAAFDVQSLTLREQLWLGLGYAALGDEATARGIEATVLEASGQRLGPWVRLAAGTSLDDSLEASGLLLLLAAKLGDPIAPDVARYLADHPSQDFVFPLEQMGYIQATLDRLPKGAGRLAWTVDGERHVVDLGPGGSFSLVLTSTQRASLRLETLAGQLAVATTWTATGGNLPSDPTVSVVRTVTPADNAPDDRLVKVTLTVSFGPQEPTGCYRLTDLLPSGLAPVVAGAGWDSQADDAGAVGPYEIDGQRVSWCVSPSDKNRTFGYSARVVTPGTYRWEPAVLQSEVAPTLGSSTPVATYTIR